MAYCRERAVYILDRAGLPPEGPHEFLEADLMRRELKPLAMFNLTVPPSWAPDLGDFDELAASGRVTRWEYRRPARIPTERLTAHHVILFALAEEAWRLEAMERVDRNEGGHDPEIIDAIAGFLLGYTPLQIATYLVGRRAWANGWRVPDEPPWRDAAAQE
ncbi:MAG: hypothetical protein KIT81_10955 [Alphaproteobacteria bacterium]|nr:hypothetical protein [Alphaproteobacteria bacterium]